jgi:hypothetical protein
MCFSNKKLLLSFFSIVFFSISVFQFYLDGMQKRKPQYGINFESKNKSDQENGFLFCRKKKKLNLSNCSVCCYEKPDTEFLVCNNCKNLCQCVDCAINSINTASLNNGISIKNLKCTSCNKEWDGLEYKNLCDSITFTEGLITKFCNKFKSLVLNNETSVEKLKKHIVKLRDAQFEIYVAKNNNIKHCPTPDCPATFIVDPSECENLMKIYHKCITCKKEYCSTCLKNFCKNGNCDKNRNDKLEVSCNLFKENKNLGQCPKCKMIIDKKDGCNNIRCNACDKTWFCFLCSEVQPKFTKDSIIKVVLLGVDTYGEYNQDMSWHKSDCPCRKNNYISAEQGDYIRPIEK